MGLFALNPVTAKRWRRFRSFRRAWYSLCLLVVLYALSLCAELICNSRPLFVWFGGRPFCPVLFHYSAHEFLGNGEALAADYKALENHPKFLAGGGWMVWPPFRFGPNDRVPSAELMPYARVNVHLAPVLRVGLVRFKDAQGTMRAFPGGDSLAPGAEQAAGEGRSLEDFWQLPPGAVRQLQRRFQGEASPPEEFRCSGVKGCPDILLRFLASEASEPAAADVWGKVLEADVQQAFQVAHLRFDRHDREPEQGRDLLAKMDEDSRSKVLKAVKEAFEGHAATVAEGSGRTYGQEKPQDAQARDTLQIGGRPYRMICQLEAVSHPYRPVPGHWLGLDDAGRDVLARILYGLRTSLTFGLVLVVSSMLFGTMIGCVQGYLGGKVDMLGQRMIEIWSALPFLYVVILMGSLFGTGFWLLIVCYALFNWIGVSYYMRAEMLRLKRLPFVEAARCLGLPWWTVVWRHILPNALVPLVTFVPFSLVGAIGALAGLDYLGFGLPPPTPSLGQLLQQAQAQREAWWLILYPSVALFVVMLLCVFIGEGVREAFDPKRQSRIR